MAGQPSKTASADQTGTWALARWASALPAVLEEGALQAREPIATWLRMGSACSDSTPPPLAAWLGRAQPAEAAPAGLCNMLQRGPCMRRERSTLPWHRRGSAWRAGTHGAATMQAGMEGLLSPPWQQRGSPACGHLSSTAPCSCPHRDAALLWVVHWVTLRRCTDLNAGLPAA